ncbi:MAG TPA: signal peptidase I [Polyangiaceae bacterium]
MTPALKKASAGRPAPAPPHSKLTRYAFWAFWFFLVPLGLAVLSVKLLKPSEMLVPTGVVERIRWLVQDQQVPAAIVLFTAFEMLLYHYRHYLPLSGKIGTSGRSDLPRELRRDFEQALQLLEEAERITNKNRKNIERDVARPAREDLSDSLDELRASMEDERFDADRFDAAHARAAELVQRHLGRWQKGELREYAESIGIAVGVALLLRAFVVEAFKIPSGSMLPTLQIQDHIFVNKFAYGPSVPLSQSRLFSNLPPKRGDVMVFEFPDPVPSNPRQDFIKRVIALEGDTLEVESGHPIINGWRVPNCRVGDYEFYEGDDVSLKRGELYVEFIGDYSYLTLFEEGHSESKQGPYQVKPGEVWVLGDNRNNSSDSRAWYGGRGGGVPYPNIKGRAMFVWWGVTADRLLVHVLGKPKLPKGAPDELLQAIEKCLAERPPVEQTTPPAARASH